MIKLKGKGVCAAIAIGKAKIINKGSPTVQKSEITDTDTEISRFFDIYENSFEID